MTQNQIQDLKQGIQIVDYLASKGIKPKHQSGDDFFYFSPFREENTASFVVSTRKNLFNDFGGIGGDVIRLVQTMENLTFPKALDFLKAFDSGEKVTFSFAEKKDLKSIDPKTVITECKEITSTNLAWYLHERGISQQTANEYLKQVHYVNDGSTESYYGIGFKNDAGGYAIRSRNMKRSISPSGITTIEVPESKAVVIFEGFINFLSTLEYMKKTTPKSTTIILNSLTNLPQAFERLKDAEIIHCFLDNDKAGHSAFKRLKAMFSKAVDNSYKYKGYKDFNEFWMNTIESRPKHV